MGLRRPNLDIAPMGVSPIAQFSILGCGQAAKAQDLDSCTRGFKSRQPSQGCANSFTDMSALIWQNGLGKLVCISLIRYFVILPKWDMGFAKVG